jgi:hypothetical protein
MTGTANPVSISTHILSRRSRNQMSNRLPRPCWQIWMIRQHVSALPAPHQRVPGIRTARAQAAPARPAPPRILPEEDQDLAPEGGDRDFVSWCLCGEKMRFESRTIAVPMSPPDSTTKTPRHEVFPKTGWQVLIGATGFSLTATGCCAGALFAGGGGSEPGDSLSVLPKWSWLFAGGGGSEPGDDELGKRAAHEICPPERPLYHPSNGGNPCST